MRRRLCSGRSLSVRCTNAFWMAKIRTSTTGEDASADRRASFCHRKIRPKRTGMFFDSFSLITRSMNAAPTNTSLRVCYSEVDENPEYDNLDIVNRDAEEKYFDEDDDEDNLQEEIEDDNMTE